MASRILRACYHYAVYAIGFIVLAAAVIVSAVRVALPDIGIYRGNVEAWVSSYMGFPVVIRSLDATWYGWTPHLYLTNIDLLNKAGTAAITHFESAAISIDPLATLYQRRFVPKQLTVSGFDVAVTRRENGAIYILGVDVGGEGDSPADNNELAEWLFLQRTIRIEKGKVEWTDHMHGQDPMLLTGVAVTLRSDGRRLQVEGSADLPQSYGKRMDIAFDASGNLLTSDWSGELYLHANDVNPDNWYRRYRPVNINIAGGSADISVWSNWTQARLVRVHGELQYRDFAAQVGGATLRVDQLDYRFSGERSADGGWRLDMNFADFATEHGLWPEANIRVHAEPLPGRDDQRYSVRFDFLKLEDVTPLVARLDFVPEAARRKLAEMQLSGELRDGRLVYDPAADADLWFESGFSGLATRFDRRYPGIRGATGRVSGSLEQGRLSFDHDRLELQLPAAAGIAAVTVEELSGDVDWQRADGSWQLRTGRLDLHTPDVDLALAGSLDLAAGAAPVLDLMLESGRGDLENVIALVPQTETFRLRSWLERSAAAGTLVSAHALLRGPLDRFPFDDGAGRFEALFNVEDVVFEYSPNWPPVDALDVHIRLDGRELSADIGGGKIFNADIEQARARIGDVLAQGKLLEIDGRVSGSIADLENFIGNSPLAGDPMLAGARAALASGRMRLALELDIPLRLPDQRAEIAGTLGLEDAELQAQDGRFRLRQVNGDVEFTREAARAEGVAASFHGAPVELALVGSRAEADNPPALLVRGNSGAEFIAARVAEVFPRIAPQAEALLPRMHGDADWELKVAFLPGSAGRSVDHHIEITSDLHGLGLDLPPPMGKNASEDIPLRIVRAPDTGKPEIRLRYGDTLDALLRLSGPDASLEAADLQFGGAPATGGGPGMRLGGKLAELDTTRWWEVFRLLPLERERELPLQADLEVAQLRLFNRDFAGVQLAATRNADAWEVRTESAALTGSMRYPRSADRSLPVRLDLDHIHLHRTGPGGADTRPLDPGTFPALDARVGSFEYGDVDLGRLTLAATPIERGINVDSFELAKPDLHISGSGQWTREDDEDESRFRIALKAGQIDAMLETFGYNVTSIRKGETTLDIDAAWTGAPSEFALAKLNGTLNMQVRRGQLLDVSPKAGRLFGLLSIQALPRRLMLDFSDLFGKGMAFDAIEGNFQIEDGNAYTNDLYMQGPSASVAVTGRTGLAEQDYDQIVTVTPRLTGTLPVAGALFGPVGVGVGAVLYLAGRVFDGMSDGFDSLLQFQYTVTGSWEEPVIEKVETSAATEGSS